MKTAETNRDTAPKLAAVLAGVPLNGMNLPASVLVGIVGWLRGRRSIDTRTKRLAALCLLCSAAVATSGYWHGVALSWANVGNPVVVAACLGFSAFVRSREGAARLAGLVLAGTLGGLLVIGPEDERAAADFAGFYKFAAAPAMSGLLVYLACRLRPRRSLVVAAFASIVLISPVLDARGPALIALISAMIWAWGETEASTRRAARIRLMGAALLSLLLLPLLISGIESGKFGQAAQQRTLRQASTSTNFLLGGRTEPPLSVAAIAQKPLVGWGNADTIDLATVGTGQRLASQLGMNSPAEYMPYWIRADGKVSLHSIAFSSWAEGGLLAALFPIVAVTILVRGAANVRGTFAPFVILLCIQSVWDIVFSPWSGGRTIFLAVALLTALFVVADRDRKRVETVVDPIPNRVGRTRFHKRAV